MANGTSEHRYDPITKKFITGRKTTYTHEIGEALINHAAQGKSVNSFCVEKRIPRSVINSWEELHEDFREQYEFAKMAFICWFETALNKQITGEYKASPAGIIFALKAFGGYRDSDANQTNIQVNYDSLPEEQKLKVLQEALKQIEAKECAVETRD